MPEKKVEPENKYCCRGGGSSSSAVYGIGLIGAIIYFFQHATTSSDYVMGVLKSLVWPAMLVYKALELLKF